MKRIRNNVRKELILLFSIYLMINACLNVCALNSAMILSSVSAWVVYIGTVLFFLSDCSLFLVRFDRDHRIYRGHFTVMLTYLLAKLLIVVGWLWMHG